MDLAWSTGSSSSSSSSGCIAGTGFASGTILNPNMLPTFRSDDKGTIQWLAQLAYSAGQVGALTIPYNGANAYVNGGRF